MAQRHRNARGDLAIRITGLLAVGVCLLALFLLARHLAGRPIGQENGWDLTLAALGFVTGSLGSVGVAYGDHLFDRIEVAPRWRRVPRGMLTGPDDLRVNDDPQASGDMIAALYAPAALRLTVQGLRR